jgi:hypothetical protein
MKRSKAVLATFAGLIFVAGVHHIMKTPRKKIDIEQVMNYPLDRVRERYEKDYKVSSQDAKMYEWELKRYLILCVEYDENEWAMYSRDVDNFWHTFLLFTKDYTLFCKKMFGKFIHHEPMDKKYDDVSVPLAKKALFMRAYEELFNEKPPEKVWKKDHGSNCCGGEGHDCVSADCCAKCKSK